MKIEKKNLSELNPAPYNPRTISDEAMKGLVESINRWGLVEPIVWNSRTGHVVGGHQRLRVLAERDEKETDVVVLDLDPAEEKALNVSLNNPLLESQFNDGLKDIINEIGKDLEKLDGLRLDELIDERSAEEYLHFEEHGPIDIPPKPYWILIRADSAKGPIILNDLQSKYSDLDYIVGTIKNDSQKEKGDV